MVKIRGLIKAVSAKFPWRAVILAFGAFYFVYVSLSLQRLLPLPYFLLTPLGIIPMYVMAMLLAIVITVWYLSRIRNFNPELAQLSILDILLWISLFGVGVGRLFHVIEFLDFYLKNPIQLLSISVGGISIFGAMLGGLLGAYIYSRRAKLNFSLLLTHLLLIWPVAFAIARSGNYFSRQLYGLPTDLPWAMYVEPEFRYLGFETAPTYHPTFLYEQILNLVLAGVIFALYRRGKSVRILLKTYVLGYLIGRFMIDFLRLEPKFLFDLSFTQVFSLILLLGAIIFGWIWQLRWRWLYEEWWRPKA